MYCDVCIHHAVAPQCQVCTRRLASCCGVPSCPFCENYKGSGDVVIFKEKLRLQPLRSEEKCERCGGPISGHVFVLHGKALCRDCLLYEQDKWEIVPAKPGGSGARVRLIFHQRKPADKEPDGRLAEDRLGKELLREMGVDPANPPPDPFRRAKPRAEGRMADDSCKNCDDYEKGKKSGKFIGRASAKK